MNKNEKSDWDNNCEIYKISQLFRNKKLFFVNAILKNEKFKATTKYQLIQILTESNVPN